MSKDRIQIDGVWYVKEKSVVEDDIELIHTRGITCENDSVCIEFIVLEDEEGELSMPSFDVSFKIKDREKEFWDNPDWMLRYSEGESEAIGELKGIDIDTRRIFEKMLECAISKGYVKKGM